MKYKRITMPREVKKILSLIGKDRKQLFCKGSRETFFGFKVNEYREDVGVLGRIVVFYKAPKRFEKVAVNFVIGHHRFFALAKFGSDEERGILKFDPVFYRLERREHLRIPLLSTVKKVGNIIRWIDKTVFIQADILDFSLGGAQISIPEKFYRPARVGSRLRIVLHVKTKWSIDVLAEVRRIEVASDKVYLGLKFKSGDERTQRQVQALAMELQREYIRNDAFVER